MSEEASAAEYYTQSGVDDERIQFLTIQDMLKTSANSTRL